MRRVDAAVVGGGPAGLAAALWLARYRRSVVVLDGGDHRSDAVEQSHGYLGRDPQRPAELLARGREELLAYPHAGVEDVRVDAITRVGDGFELCGLHARRLLLACGVRDVLPDVAGIEEHYGRSVFHCPSCDGYEARDRDILVLGWDPHVAGFAATLLTWARSVTVVTNGHAFRGDQVEPGIRVLEADAVRFLGERGDLRGVELDTGEEVKTTHVFFSVAHAPRNRLAESLGCETDADGYVVVDDCGRTSVENVYAAGDLVPGLQLVQVAAATGTVAGVAAATSLTG
ncbi:MAG: NAD(P)/FAD-dependent oxidoreductase [Frankiales bacterium]|nr:NAD(P)/FAD-dependent oxidoreductase [Frankiales bacterium]